MTYSRILLRFVLFAALWALLSHGQGWLLGVLFVCLATLLSLRIELYLPPLRLGALPAFIACFVGKLMGSGFDVARRAYQRNGVANADWRHYNFTTADVHVRLLLSALIGLLPGTLAARIEEDHMLVHTLDVDLPWQHDIAQLERLLCRLMATDCTQTGVTREVP